MIVCYTKYGDAVMKKLISIVVPCYNEEDAIPIFFSEICKVIDKMKEVNFEIIFVDDGSKDKTLEVIKEIEDKIVKYISFSRNFGKEAAIYAGLEHSKGDYITVMDVDLQDPPSLIYEMYNILESGEYDCVATRRVSREGEPLVRSFLSEIFYKIINKLSKIEMVSGARDFQMMKRKVVNSVLSLKEYNRYSKGIFSFVGFKTKWLEFNNIERSAGKSKWDFGNLFVYAIDGICAFSTIPLVGSALVGLVFCLISFIMIFVIIFKTLVFGDPVSGWPSMVCIMFFIGGIQLFCMGIMGEYMAKTYLETKHRPIYIMRESSYEEIK